MLRPRQRDLERSAASAPSRPAFEAALRGDDVALIAEVKRRSPSQGDINVDLRADEQAASYALGGAAAISVLTEPQRFGGAAEDLSAVAARVAIPLLRKDFLVEPVQLLEARSLGASAVLLIARALDAARLVLLVDCARSSGLEPVVEIRDEAELDRALAAGARVIGVNNRDLETLRVDSTTVTRIVPRIPWGLIAVAESGYSTRAAVEEAAAAGADAVLVGSALSAAFSPRAAAHALIGVLRLPRAR